MGEVLSPGPFQTHSSINSLLTKRDWQFQATIKCHFLGSSLETEEEHAFELGSEGPVLTLCALKCPNLTSLWKKSDFPTG